MIDVRTRAVVRTIDLGGQPDSIAIGPDGSVTAVAIENERDEDLDLERRHLVTSFSAGTVTRSDADTVDDQTVTFDDLLTAPREPDAVQWTRDGNLVTADEGDLAAEPSGGRSDDEGAEFEGAEIASLRGTDYAFFGSERGDPVLVYDVGNEGDGTISIVQLGGR